MGYSTSINIRIIHQKRLSRQWEQKAFANIIDEATKHAEFMSCCQGDDHANFNDHNSDAIDAVVEMSKKYPSLLLEADGQGEDDDDIWIMRIRRGKNETLPAKILFPQFTELLTPEERKAARWKASRRSKCTEDIHYDPRVGRALRLLRNLIDNPPKSNLNTVDFYPVDLYPALDLLERLKRNMLLHGRKKEND